MGGQTTAAAETERFFNDLEGDEPPLPSNQEQDSEFDRFNPGPQLCTLAEESEPTSLSIQEGNYIIFDDQIDDAKCCCCCCCCCCYYMCPS
jgi:hypothetical protein